MRNQTVTKNLEPNQTVYGKTKTKTKPNGLRKTRTKPNQTTFKKMQQKTLQHHNVFIKLKLHITKDYLVLHLMLDQAICLLHVMINTE